MTAPPRRFFGGAALASLVIGAAVPFAVIVADEALRSPGSRSAPGPRPSWWEAGA